MIRGRRWFAALLVSTALAPMPLLAATSADVSTLSERAARRFPQPVRVGELIGRQVLEPIEAQHVLGYVEAIVRRPDGSENMIVRFGGVLGFGTRLIAVPVEAVALLGEYVAIIDFTPEQLNGFPNAGQADPALPPDDVIRVGLAKPFH